MPRYATGSKNIIALERNAAKKITGKVLKLEGPDVADSAKFLNQNSIDILKKLRAQMVAQKIHIDDMQFLIKADGTYEVPDAPVGECKVVIDNSHLDPSSKKSGTMPMAPLRASILE